MDLKDAEPVLFFGAVAVIVAWGGWHLYQEHAATVANTAAQQAEVTPSATDLVAGLTPLAPDIGTGIADILPDLPGTTVAIDPFTGTYAEEIDPTTGEIGIGGTEDLSNGMVLQS